MLNKETLRYKIDNGRVTPYLLRPTPGNLATAERILKFWQDGVGQRRGELEEAAKPVLHAGKSLVVGRGLQKLILDECAFSDPESTERLRREALLASAAALAKPAASSAEHRARIAAEINLGPDDLANRLYGDLPHAALLTGVPEWNPGQLLERYNLALCQGLLLSASEMTITVSDADVGMRRRLLKALRFRRLLATVSGDRGGELRLTITGPNQIVDQSSRYGLQFALFLPALCCAETWHALATLTLGSDRTAAALELSHELGLIGDSAFLAYVPEEIRSVEESLREKFPEWRCDEAQLMPLPGGEMIVPDLQIRVGDETVAVECFHRWHEHALRRRLDHLGRGLAPRLVIAVDRAIAKRADIAALIDTPVFARHGCLFSDIPTPRALGDAIRRVLAGAATASQKSV